MRSYAKLAEEMDELFNRDVTPEVKPGAQIDLNTTKGGIDFDFQSELKMKGNPRFELDQTFIKAGDFWSAKASHFAEPPSPNAQSPLLSALRALTAL